MQGGCGAAGPGRRVWVHGRRVDRAAEEFALLAALAKDPRRVVTKRELLRDGWGYLGNVRTRTVDSHASRLRRKLAAGGAGASGIVGQEPVADAPHVVDVALTRAARGERAPQAAGTAVDLSLLPI